MEYRILNNITELSGYDFIMAFTYKLGTVVGKVHYRNGEAYKVTTATDTSYEYEIKVEKWKAVKTEAGSYYIDNHIRVGQWELPRLRRFCSLFDINPRCYNMRAIQHGEWKLLCRDESACQVNADDLRILGERILLHSGKSLNECKEKHSVNNGSWYDSYLLETFGETNAMWINYVMWALDNYDMEPKRATRKRFVPTTI